MADLDHPIFIVGCPRSGTGILHQLVRLHPSVAWITPFSNWLCGKSWFQWVPPSLAYGMEWILQRTPNPLLPPLFRGPYDGSLGLPATFETHEGHSIWHRVVPDAPDHSIKESVATSEVRDYLHAVVDWHRRYHGRPRFVWKTPRNVFRLRFLHAVFPEAYVVHIVRDGRAVAASILKRRRHDRQNVEEWWGVRPPKWRAMLSEPPIIQAAWTWTQCLERVRTDASLFSDDHFLEMRYESLTTHPEDELRRLFSFVGLAPDRFFTPDNEDQLRAIRAPRPTWKSRLDEHQKSLLRDELAPTLQAHGYDGA